MVLKGLNILNALKEAKLEFEPPDNSDTSDDTTIVKSKIFQLSLKYAPLLKKNPIPIIFKVASTP